MQRGFFETIGGADGEAAGMEVLRDLGASWDIVTDMEIKLVPGGHPYHALAEAAAAAVREGRFSADQITSITISRPGMTELHGPLHPTNLIDMAHSPAYFAAAGAADGTFSWEHAGPAKIADPAIHRLIDCVRVGEPPGDAHYRQGATVPIRLHDGREISDTVYVPKGAAMLGISWNDVDHKYRNLVSATGLDRSKIEASLDLVHDFHHVPTVTPFIRLLEID